MKKKIVLTLTALLAALAMLGLCSCSKNALIDPSDDTTIKLPDNSGVSDGTQGDGTQGDGTQGDGTQGDGTQGDGTQGDGTQGDGTQGDGTQGDGTQGDGTQGDGTQGDGTQGDGTQGDGTQGDGSQGDGTQGDGSQDDTTTEPEDVETVEQILARISFNDAEFTYDGTKKALAIEGDLPERITVKYFNNNISVAGEYVVTAKFYENGVYVADKDKTATLTIKKATYDMSGIKFYNSTLPYDGTEKSLVVVGDLPEGVTVSYVGNGKTEGGTYTVTAKFSGNTTNYHPIPDMTATLKIYYTSLSGVTFNGLECYYDATPKSIFIEGELPEGVTVSYDGNGVTNAGTYEITASFHSEREEYRNLPDMKATLKINKIDLSVAGISFESEEFIIDGLPHSIYVSGELHPNIKVTYKGNGKIGLGEHTVTAVFTYLDSENYNLPALTEMTATMTIARDIYASDGLTYEYVEETDSYTVTGYEGNRNFVVIPNLYNSKNVTEIYLKAFKNSRLEYVYIGKNVTTIGDYAFDGASVKQVDFAGNVTRIGRYAFINSKLESIVLPSTLTEINEGTFTHCKSLTDVYIPKSITTVHDGGSYLTAPFFGCTADLMLVLEDRPTSSYEEFWANVISREKALIVPFVTPKDYENNKDELRNQSATDDTLQKIFINGTAVEDFDPELLEFEVVFNYEQVLPEVEVYASSALASVSVTPPTEANGYKLTVVCTSADGSSSRTYCVTLVLE